MSYNGGFKDCTFDISRSTEFTNDDADQYSELVDLTVVAEKLTIVIPTIDSATISVYAQENGSVATIPKPVHYRQTSDNATAEWTTTAGAGGITIVCDCLGGYRWIRLKASANQTDDRTFRVCGIRG
jgi:hypothetical protein